MPHTSPVRGVPALCAGLLEFPILTVTRRGCVLLLVGSWSELVALDVERFRPGSCAAGALPAPARRTASIAKSAGLHARARQQTTWLKPVHKGARHVIVAATCRPKWYAWRLPRYFSNCFPMEPGTQSREWAHHPSICAEASLRAHARS